MSRFAQWRYTSVAVMMLVACRGRDRSASDTASASAMADSVSATVVSSDSTTAVASTAAVATGTGTSLDTTKRAAPIVDLAATKSGAKSGERTKDASGDMMVLERGSCRGGCIPYQLNLRADGKVTFTLLGGTKKKSSDSIAATSVRTLLESMRAGGFATLDSAYVQGSPGCGAYAADAPIVVLATVRAGTTHSVRHDYGCTDAPRALRRWGAAADSIARTARWLPSTSGKSK